MAYVEDYDLLCKIVLVGDVSVGKTHLLARFLQGELPTAPTATVGVEFNTRNVVLPNGVRIKAQIWDTAGQERYRSITRAHYRRAAGAVLVYDVCHRGSFLNCEQWMREVKEGAAENVAIMLAGNKLDLVERDASKRQVCRDSASDFARLHGLSFAEVSAVTGVNVRTVFDQLLQEVSAHLPAPATSQDLSRGMGIDSVSFPPNDGCQQGVNAC
eukprot:TRINITY_DN39642_c0_g1_i1.p1 TRINITY_DN39642_c0_g1~~TRINITY_DN39642_c0_g1_i1.p1  ORF type:complete len:214 (-),score=36.36 TRINITY_DN39642_c0_g1_i1:196-837(-)